MTYFTLIIVGLLVLPFFLLFVGLLLAVILSVFFDHADSAGQHETREVDDGEAQ